MFDNDDAPTAINFVPQFTEMDSDELRDTIEKAAALTRDLIRELSEIGVLIAQFDRDADTRDPVMVEARAEMEAHRKQIANLYIANRRYESELIEQMDRPVRTRGVA